MRTIQSDRTLFAHSNLESGLRTSPKRSRFAVGFASIAVGWVALVNPAFALQVQLVPAQPQLGDTLSVTLEVEDSRSRPTVKMGQTTYPVFPLGNNRYRALVPTTPLNRPGSLTLEASGDGEVKVLRTTLRDRAFSTQRIRLSGGGSNATELELNRVAVFKSLVTPEKFWSGLFLRPTQGNVSTVFGVRRYYNGVFAENYYHRGVDYAASAGTSVIAPASGRVALVGRESEGFRVHGNTVGIDHGQGVLSIFLHLSRITANDGDFVQAGQQIGTVGSTGASTGPHLHWGLYVHGQAVDPVPWRFQGIE
ncbi:M23 family metallopeptidase [Lusitaniella coriacea LEGE 07157]|uniref:M23 family metallopeptidase n=1 Tax=Lusitaniella coriacea LEGE 07157 TaxID=945747 RepID=A0A8J7JE50_9CYAN|nr:M23 family metallopeptidase [Lusitaniella coriacea]MBE9118660.1 M23 family metallopeptidase [Lusitaniella coriacea LEGE 07157]